VDGSIPCRDLGKLATPVTLAVRKGVIAAISGRGPEAGILEQVFAACGRPEARVLAEFGIGLNPLASLTGRMLEDEGCAGTIHLGFGSNATIGGRNHVPFHLDFVVREPTVWIGKEIILYRGKLTDSVRQCAA
jgi:leucyl aminopeptidase (aminopeptidase T)